jgi:RimJ/RimL family protein N-acetyltransferase
MISRIHQFIIDKKIFNKSVLDSISPQDLLVKLDMAKRELVTVRLILKPFKAQDIDEYYKLYEDSAVMEKYCDGKTRTAKEIDQLLQNCYNQKEPSYFSIFLKDKKLFIGTIFLTTRNQESGEILLGFVLHKNYWGNYYTKEALYALLYCLFPIARSQINTVIATTRDDNIASIKILKSFDFEYCEKIKKYAQQRLLYKMDAKKINQIHHQIKVDTIF